MQCLIYVNSFSKVADQGTRPETGDYNITPFTGYSFDSCSDLSHFLIDPMAYIIAMGPSVAFCAGILLPDYNSSQFEVDANAKDTII